MLRLEFCILLTSLFVFLKGRMASASQQDAAASTMSEPSPGSLISFSTAQLIELLRKEESEFTLGGKKRGKTCHAVGGKGSNLTVEAGKSFRRLAKEGRDESGPSVQLYPVRLLVPSLVLDSQDHTHLKQKLKNLVERLCGLLEPLSPCGGVKILLPSEVGNDQIAEIVDAIKEEGLKLEPDFSVKLAGKVTPDDPLFSDLWAIEEVQLSSAWELETTEKLKADARPIVCVSDSGVDYTHEDLYENIFVNEAEQLGLPDVDDDNNGYVDDIYGINVYDHSQLNNPMDNIGHGTHVAGTLGAVGNNAKGVCGAAWRPRMIPCKFIGESPGAVSGAIDCITYCVSRGAKVSVHSYSFTIYSEALETVMRWAETQGLLMVFAAGNYAADTKVDPSYPACYASKLAGAFSVANTRRTSPLDFVVLNRQSNYGECIHVGCPGTEIVSTLSHYQGQPYGSMDGSSMAAALMAGMVTLMVAVKPDLSPAECKQIVQRCITRIPSLRNSVQWGGAPDAFCLVHVAMSGSASRRVSWWSTFAAAGVGLTIVLLRGDF